MCIPLYNKLNFLGLYINNVTIMNIYNTIRVCSESHIISLTIKLKNKPNVFNHPWNFDNGGGFKISVTNDQ